MSSIQSQHQILADGNCAKCSKLELNPKKLMLQFIQYLCVVMPVVRFVHA